MKTLNTLETTETSTVQQALQIAKNQLNNFASSADFKTQMQIALGTQRNWETTDLINFPAIEIRPAAEINNARGAFAAATNTIYLSQELVNENTGNVGAIASVLLEEYGHYIDAQINAIDSPGDEGELFANLVQGKILNESDILSLRNEDDSAIVVWDGERVAIEQQVQSDNLNFFAGEIKNWTDNPGKEYKTTLLDEKIPEQPLEQKGDNLLFNYDFAAQSSLKAELFATPLKYGEAKFSYPINLQIELPNNLTPNQSEDIKLEIPQVSSALFADIGQGSKGFEIPNAGFKFGLTLDQVKFKNIEIKNPFGDPIKLDGIDAGSQLGKAELNLDIDNFLVEQGNFLLKDLDLFGGKITVKLPKIDSLLPTKTSDNPGQLPAIAATGRSENILNLGFDLDKVILSKVPQYKILQESLKPLGIGLEGLGFSINYPNSLSLKSAEKKAQEDVDSARLILKIQQTPEALQELGRREVERRNIAEELAKTEKLRNKIQISGDILDIQANIGLTLQQEFKFEPEKVQVTLSVDKGSVDGSKESTKSLGELFKMTAPSEGCGVMKVKAKYELFGKVKNNIGAILQGSIDGKALQLGGKITLAGAKIFADQFGPLFSGKLPKGGLALSPEFTLIGSEPDPNPFLPTDSTLESRKIKTIEISELKGVELDDKNPQGNATQNLMIEKEYEIPYNLPVSVSDASVTEGDSGTTDMLFPVTLRDVPNESVTLSYSSPKGSGAVTIAAGQTSGEIKIPVTGDTQKEDNETFTLTVKDQNGKLFADCEGEVDSVSATGIIIDDDDKPKPPEPNKNPHEFNDPRYITIDGKSLEFQAAGEFTLLESLNDDYKIQIRQQPVGNDPLKNASNATAVATILGGKRVGLYQDSQQLLIDGVPTTIPDNEYIFVGEGRIYREGNRYSFVYPKGDQLIATMTENRINVSLFLSPERRDTVRGIFGTYNDNPDDDLLKSDGTVLTSPISPEQLYGEYADSWRVGQTESLFDYQPGEDTNKFTISNYPRKKVKLSDLDPADIQKAEELIGDRITDPTIRETAIIDLVLTDFDPEVIEAAINVPSPQSSVIIRVDPETKADFTSTFANTPVKINPLTNDIVTTGIPLSLTGYDQTTAKGGTIQLDNNGTPDDKTDDQLTYTPPTNFVGIDTINYTIADDQKTATGTITVAVPAINLNALNGNNGFSVTGAAGNFAGSSLSNIGDFNGDTIDDFIVGGFAADPNNINATGESYVVFGTNQGFPANFDLSTLNGTNGFIIEGFETESFSGGAVSSAGDINGDGLKDLIIGAFSSDSNSLNDSGRTYVILGSNQPFSTRFNLANLNGNNGFAINSNQPLDYSGLAVSSAGDFNNDGLDDLAVAAPAGIDTFLGKVYLVYGRNNSFPPAFDPSDLQWDDGIVINHNNGLAGTTVSNAGDINGDQIDDLIIGAEQGSLEGNPKAGETYVLFGKDGGYQNGFSLSNLDGTNGFTIKGDGYSVSSVSGAGDINADGLEDIIIGVSQSPGNNQTNAGKAYVVFGTQAGFTQQIDLFTLNGNNGFVINGVEPDELLGGSVKGAGDINGDKIDDIIIGASGATANGIKSAGKTYIVFGSQKGFPASLNSSDLNGEKGFFLNGTAENELSGLAVSSAGDINQDSVNDILIGAPGSLFDNTAGKSYVVFGNSTFGNQAII
jgi:hypothetical protein